jgi:predicted aspartyl protease
MSIKDFYSFGSKLVSSTVQVHAVGLKEFFPVDPDKTYPYDENKLIRGDYTGISFPVVFKQQDGDKLQDVLDTGWSSLYLISDKMKAVLEENEITGWKTFAVKVFDRKEQEIKGYHGLSITGKCGPVDYNKSTEIIEKQLVPNGPVVRYGKGLYVGLDEWDSSDIFIPEKSGWIVVTKRTAEALKKNKLANIKLENLAEIEIDQSM